MDSRLASLVAGASSTRDDEHIERWMGPRRGEDLERTGEIEYLHLIKEEDANGVYRMQVHGEATASQPFSRSVSQYRSHCATTSASVVPLS